MTETKPEYLPYTQPATRYRYRQLNRAASGWPNAFDQLDTAFIFHWRASLAEFKHRVRRLAQLRCPMCGSRHIRGRLVARWRSSSVSSYPPHCFYGWWYGLRSIFAVVRSAGKHGED